MLMDISLRHLTYFRALCECGHFAHAAEVCAVSQPALSVKIQELEEILSAPLIDRNTRPYRPTPLGRDVLRQAQQVLDGVDALHDLARMERGLEGPFTLGVIPTVAPYILPPVLGRLHTDLPKLDLQVREATTEVLLGELRDGQLDAIIIATDVEDDLSETPLFDDRFLLAISSAEADRLSLRDGQFELTDMTRFRLLLLSEGHCLRDQVQSICRFTSRETLNQIGASSLQTLIGLSAGGYGVTLVPEIAAPEAAATQNLTLLHLSAPEPARTLRFVTKSNAARMPNIDALTGIFREVGETLTKAARKS